MPRHDIRVFRSDDFAACRELIAAASLPVADLSAERLALVAESDGEINGVIGLEAFGDTGLLRSLSVAPAARRNGTGRALVEALEAHAAEQSIRELWLLTIDADGYFEKLGYECRARQDAPAAIAATEEFSGLCPADSVLMSKRL